MHVCEWGVMVSENTLNVTILLLAEVDIEVL